MILVLFSLILISYLWLKRKMLLVLVFHFVFPANIWFPKLDAFDFSTAFLISKISALDSFSTCLLFKMRSFDFSNVTFDFPNLSRLIYEMALWFPKLVSFDFSIDTFDFQNLSRLISQMAFFISKMRLIWILSPWQFLWVVSPTQGRGNGHNDQTRQRRCFSEKWECAAG